MTNFDFSLENKDLYQAWRDKKLKNYPVRIEQLTTSITNALAPEPEAIQTLRDTVNTYNFALYRFEDARVGKPEVHRLAQALGLKQIHANLCADADSLTSIEMTQHEGQHDYIPYTDKKLSWHTDGYYHAPKEAIHGMLLHCVRPAYNGGMTKLMDHEIAYILLREANPAYITALLHPQAFTIPANVLNGEVIRPAQTGAVLSIGQTGRLHMRYSARQRNVEWRNDAMTQAAADFLLSLWEQETPYHLHYTLQAGEGLVCNNVLHCRSAFVDATEPDRKRLLYRGRYLDRIN
ncbi:TauD/TfdA family dioxygenase [Thiolinea disciformis]|uniref:TauD/TfdA family dioxygenase n=1 Tax=Thiolinea disciformis TaxID=125614 RepID=UPI0003612065|nr:TauD/TfdA family dioxygenase [Thiolinea disciformis]